MVGSTILLMISTMTVGSHTSGENFSQWMEAYSSAGSTRWNTPAV